MDDEDLNSKKRFAGEERVKAEKAVLGVLSGILGELDCEEKSIYFENEEEAQALMKKHFSGKRIPEVKSFKIFLTQPSLYVAEFK